MWDTPLDIFILHEPEGRVQYIKSRKCYTTPQAQTCYNWVWSAIRDILHFSRPIKRLNSMIPHDKR